MKLGRFNIRFDGAKTILEALKAIAVWLLLMFFFTVPATFGHLVAIFFILIIAQAQIETK